MGKRLSNSDKEKIKQLHKDGLSYKEISKIVGASPTTVSRWLNPESRTRYNSIERVRHHLKQPLKKYRDYQLQKAKTFFATPKGVKLYQMNQITMLAKLGKYYNKSWYEMFGLLENWKYQINLKYNWKCIVCGLPGMRAHHLFQRRWYPKLSLNLNNGVCLCKYHHSEIHSPWNTVYAGQKVRDNFFTQA